MRKVVFSLIIISIISCKNEIQDKSFFIKEFNWHITVPEGFNYMGAEEIIKYRDRGKKLIEETYNEEVIDQTKNLFFIENGQLNKFEANYQPFDETIDGDYLEVGKNIRQLLVETFTINFEGVKIDTISSTEIIDKLEFQKFNIKVTYSNNMVLHLYMFNRLFDKKELTCTIAFIDEKIGSRMLNSLLKSKFKKK